MSSPDPVIAFLHSSTGGALVWGGEGAHVLRSGWRVVGGLSGALPLQPRQNAQLGLPLHLSPEEVTLLRERGVLDLRVYSPPKVSEKDVATFSELREREAQLQFEAYQEKRRQLSKQFSGHEEKAPPPPPLSFSPLTHILTGDPRMHCGHTHFPVADWTYPSTTEEVCRYAVFKDLWQRGYTITTAVKYGGDFLVYAGDPALVHSHYIALVLPWKQPITTLVTLCRLGSKVVKAILLCSVNEDGNVHYQTVQWAR